MGKRLRAGVIGCGAIAERLHVPDYATCPEAELVALCDVVAGKARGLAARWAPSAKVFTDYRKMLKGLDLDCVTIALPNYLHASATIAALEAGCHVLVEKPMAATVAEAARMVETAKRCDRVLMVNQSQRRYPAHRKAKEVIDSGILGKILQVTAMFGHAGPEHWSPASKWFFKKRPARFGAMADLGVHKADLIRYLTGKEVAEICGYFARLEKRGSEVDDNFVSALRFTDGALGTLSASWTVKGMGADYVVLHCSNGSLRIGQIPGKPLVASLSKPGCEIEFEPPPPIIRYAGSWGIDISGAFVRACLGLEEPFCTGEEGKKSLEIILAAEQSARTGRSVKLQH